MLAVLMSMKPEWWEKILAGEKTLEIRKTHPQNERLEWPVTVLVYVSGRHICQCLFSPAVRDGIAVVRHCNLYFQTRSLGINAEDTYLLHISFHCLEVQIGFLNSYGHHERGILEHPGNLLAIIHESLSDFRSRLIQEVRVLSLVASCAEYQHAGSQPYSV